MSTISASQLLNEVNGYLQTISYVRQPQQLYAPIEYILALGGKRIRPVLMLLAYNLYKEDVKAILPQALAIETYHNHTLLHDDLMDHADVRRGKPTVHKVWDENTAILSGDTMLLLSYRLLGECNPAYLPAVLSLFTETNIEICEGQQWDMEFETRQDVTVVEYMEMIRLKTSVLVATSLKMGAILGDASPADAEALYQFGIQMGLGFQLQDDYLDVYGDAAVFGKNIGGDILCNKKTFMLITALARCNEEQRQRLTQWLDAVAYVPQEKIAAVTALYNELGIKACCKAEIEAYYNRGFAILDAIDMPQERKAELRQFVSNLINRDV
ncbi:MAG: polyprenyl synthetase family protein [Phocaeicola sp.]